jgi:hypothetical protein
VSAPRAVPAGQVNRVALYLGPPGCGKSNLAMRHLTAPPGGYLIAHESAAELPARLEPGGERPHYVRHASVAACRAALAVDARGVHAIRSEDGGEVLGFAMELGESAKATNGIPVRVLLDESAASAGSSARRLGPEFGRYLMMRRHFHTELYLCCQSPWRLHYAFIELSTDVYVFRLEKKEALVRLADEGMPDEMLARIPTLAEFECVHWERLKAQPAKKSRKIEDEKSQIVPRVATGVKLRS